MYEVLRFNTNNSIVSDDLRKKLSCTAYTNNSV